MYELLHSERIKSNPINGVVLIAQLRSGEVHYEAELEHGVPRPNATTHTFIMRQDEWDSDRSPYVLDLRQVYKNAFATEEAAAWRTFVVDNWEAAQKKLYLQKSIDGMRKMIAERERELERLDKLYPNV